MSDSSQSQISYWRLLWPGAYLRRILRSDDFYQALQAHIKQSVPGKLLLPALILFYCTGGRLAIALSGVLVVAFRTIMNVFAKELRLFLVALVHYLSWGSTV